MNPCNPALRINITAATHPSISPTPHHQKKKKKILEKEEEREAWQGKYIYIKLLRIHLVNYFSPLSYVTNSF